MKPLTIMRSIQLVFIFCFLQETLCARVLKLHEDRQPRKRGDPQDKVAEETKGMINEILEKKKMNSTVDSEGNGLRETEVSRDKDGNTIVHADQQFKGLKVMGSRVIDVQTMDHRKLLISKKTGRAVVYMHIHADRDEHGTVVEGIAEDIPDSLDVASLNPYDAIKNLTKLARGKVEHAEGEAVVFVDEKKGKAKVGFMVTIFDNNGHDPSMPTQIVDAETGEVMESWDSLQVYKHRHKESPKGDGPVKHRLKESPKGDGPVKHRLKESPKGGGPGGNIKTGEYVFGKQEHRYTITELGNGSCQMETKNVKAVHLQHQPAKLYTDNKPWTFKCFENQGDGINGAFSPINDALAFGEQIYAMYMEWYGEPPLREADGAQKQLVLKTHYLKNYQNAFWNGQFMVFGDGGTQFFPMISLDVTSHEIAHGVTALSSALEYRGESGALNEAFADMAGKAAERFMHGKDGVKWTVGEDLVKAKNESLRRMDEPWTGKSGREIGHMVDYTNSMPVHYASGIFNRAFYLMSQKFENDVWDAFDLFYIANTRFWSSRTTFTEAAELMLKATDQLKNGKHLKWDYRHIKLEDIVSSYRQVGIDCEKVDKVWRCIVHKGL